MRSKGSQHGPAGASGVSSGELQRQCTMIAHAFHKQQGGSQGDEGEFTMTIESINPATEEVLASFEEATPAQIEAALAGADGAFRTGAQRHSPSAAA